jgi:tetratricopeptide (TPR) repeat protein
MRRLLVARLAFIIVAMGFGSLPAASQQSTTATIAGSVKVNGGLPNERIEVKLEARFVVVGVTYADMQGKFSFIDLPPNLYHIIVDEDDYYPVRVDAVVSSVSAQNIVVSVDLRSKPKPGVTATAAPSGGNPNMVDRDALGKNFPKDAVKAFEKGVKLSNEGKLDAAIHSFEVALQTAPTFYQARNNLGSVLLAKGEYGAAQKQFEEVIKLQQADAAAYFNLGNVFLLTNRGTECYQALQEGLRREPNSAKGQFLLGSLFARTGRPQEAEKQLEHVLQLDPTMSQVHLELANLYIRQQNQPQAIAELTTFLTRFPQDPMAGKAKEVLTRLGGKVPQMK